LLVFIFFGCGNSGGSDSPMNAVKDFVAAVKERNYSKAFAQMNDKSKKEFETIGKQRNLDGMEYFQKTFPNASSLGILGQNFSIADQKQEEDFATVTIRTDDGKVFDVYTEKEGGLWRIDYSKTSQNSIIKEE
jgi:hypothetical protein